MINLDPQQLAAVTTKSRRALVVAGAGSGKTRVLTERIAHLIEQEHASPYEILCWTFTRKAAGEMRERLVNRIGVQAPAEGWGTRELRSEQEILERHPCKRLHHRHG